MVADVPANALLQECMRTYQGFWAPSRHNFCTVFYQAHACKEGLRHVLGCSCLSADPSRIQQRGQFHTTQQGIHTRHTPQGRGKIYARWYACRTTPTPSQPLKTQPLRQAALARGDHPTPRTWAPCATIQWRIFFSLSRSTFVKRDAP